jgi:Uma2 family endonuclease
MTAIPPRVARAMAIPELHNGDHVSREEFHRIYEQMPPNFKAELIGGIVYVASPLSRLHGNPHAMLTTLFGTYAVHTPGVETADNTTVLLGEEGEPQPDLFLRILPECGGQSRTTPDDQYVEGAPELIAEVAHTSRAIELHAKRRDYTRYGVREYLVLSVRDRRMFWFDLRADRELTPDADGIIRVHTFPGLWIDVEAILTKDPRMIAVISQGLATPEHAAFVESLTQARAARGRRKKPARGKRKGRGSQS